MTPALKELLLSQPPWFRADFPRSLGNLAAWYDISDVGSLRNNAGSIPANTDGIKLWADKSGNSGVNCLCLNGGSGNQASALDSAAISITGDLDLRMDLACDTWTPGATHWLFNRASIDNQASYDLGLATTGVLQFRYTPNGTFASLRTANSSVATGFAAFARRWVRVTYASASGNVNFYTSSDGVTWSALGVQQSVTSGAIFDGTNPLYIGNQAAGTGGGCRVYRAQIYNGIAGTLAFDANFTAVAKLATSFTESSANAATVTINTSGDTGARIAGERDLCQMTGANQPIASVDANGRLLTFDGSNDYLKAPAFSLAQPCTVYFVGSQVTWTDQDAFLDGNTLNSMLLFQRTTTPGIGIFAGTSLGNITSLAVATNGILASVYNNAASSIRHNRNAPVTGLANTSNGNGLTVGARADASAPGNITVREVLIFSAAHSRQTQDRIVQYLGRKWRIAV